MHYQFNSIEELFDKISYVDSHDLQLKKGLYLSDFSQIIYEGSMIQRVYTNISTSCEGKSHRDYYMFILVTSKDKQIFRNCTLNYSSIIVIKPLSEYKKISFGENHTLVVSVPKKKVEDRFGSIQTGVYEIKEEKDIDILLYLTFKLFNQKLITYDFMNYLSSLLIDKIQVVVNNIHNICNNCKQCNSCKQFYEIVHFMKKEYKNHIDIKEIAEYFKISERTLRNIFSKKMGISPKQYQKVLQMNNLKQAIMKTPHYSISDIIINQGLSSQSFVTKEFKSFFYTTPNEFKKICLN